MLQVLLQGLKVVASSSKDLKMNQMETVRQPSESQIQGSSVLWFNRTYREYRRSYLSIHNNADDEVKGAIAVGLGRVKGASDTVWFSPWGALLIEFKDHKGTQKEEQKTWEWLLAGFGYTYVLCRSLEQFQYIITSWIDTKGKITTLELESNWLKRKWENENRK